MTGLRARALGSRTLALVLPVILIGMLYVAVVQPLQTWQANLHSDLGDTRVSINRLHATLKQSTAKGAADPKDQRLLTTDFLQGTDEPLIIADLQTRLRAIVIGQNGELTSASTLPPRLVDKQAYLGLRLQLRATMAGTHTIISAIEGATPLLFIERAAMRMDERRDTGDEQPGELALMVVELDVYGAKWSAPDQAAVGDNP
jgi:hypothetical protein